MLSFKNLDIHNFLDGHSYIEIAEAFAEFATPHLCKIEHVMHQKVKYFDSRSLNLDTVNLLASELFQNALDLGVAYLREVRLIDELH